MGNYNPNYFDRKSSSLEEAIRNAVNGVKTQIDEKVTEYIELEFKDKQSAINAYKTINNKVYPGGTQPFEDINQEGNSIQLDKVDNAKKVLADFKKVGRLQFKVAVEEKMDAVGKEDGDIDNDGDKDSSDKYLAKRRKAIGKSMKNEAQDGGDFKPHMMYDPKTGKGYEAKTMEDHLRMKKMGYDHEKPKMDESMKGFKVEFGKGNDAGMAVYKDKKDAEAFAKRQPKPIKITQIDVKNANMFDDPNPTRKEAYEIGTPENTKAKLDATPGQSSDEWNQQVEIMQKKNTSMREALAKVWGFDEGKNPFEKEEGKQSNPDNFEPFKKKGAKKEDKTMTGKPATKVSVDPKEEKKN